MSITTAAAATRAPLKIGIMGYGWATRTFHLPFILPHTSEFSVRAIYQRPPGPNPAPGRADAAADHPTIHVYPDVEGFLGDREVELVVVATATSSHFEHAKRALEAGKHVMVEKPFVASAEEADALLKIAREKGRVLTVFHNRRYDSDFLTLQSLVHQGVLGEVKDAVIHMEFPYEFLGSRTPPTPYAPGGGMMWSLGAHIIDQALSLWGTPASVTGFYRSIGASPSPAGSGPTMADNAYIIILQYGPPHSDLLVTLKTTVVTLLSQQQKFVVRGEEGSFVKYGQDEQVKQIMGGMDSMDPAYGYEDPSVWGTLTTRKQVLPSQEQVADLWEGKVESKRGDHHSMYRDVAKVIRGEIETPVIDPRVARDGIRIIELARRSQEEGRTLKF